jgi:small subunit ribosomal protein S4
LREKQSARRIYGLTEQQFKDYFYRAAKKPGVTGENLLIMLEKRLDNVIFRLGLADSRPGARQLVTHRHFQINGRICNIPSYQVKAGDQIMIIEKSRPAFKEVFEKIKEKSLPTWLTFNQDNLTGCVVAEVTREMIDTPIDDRLIVEHYSR